MVLFEPQPEPFERLRRNVPGAEHHNVALGAQKGEAIMYLAEPSHSSSLLHPFTAYPEDGVVFDGTLTVEVRTLDEMMNGHEGFDELWIDTQGYELEVLLGAGETLREIRKVRCEVHDPIAYPGAATLRQLDELLGSHGFVRTAEPPEAVWER